MTGRIKKDSIKCIAIIAICFLLTSTGWLSWEYHLLGQVPAFTSDMCTMVIGYLLQAVGIGIYALVLHRKPSLTDHLFPAALVLHLVCMFPAVTGPHLTGTLIFGFLMNILCGIIAGHYLRVLSEQAPQKHKATVFGIGYSISILASWLLSLINGGSIYYSEKVLLICAVLTAGAVYLNIKLKPDFSSVTPELQQSSSNQTKPIKRSFLMLACALVLLFSVVNSSGFAFPSTDLGSSVNVEFSRLVYAVGLIIAGIMTDKNRKYGAVCALSALVIPFIILSLRGESYSAILFWALSYFTFGFYSVYRIILFSDIASKYDMLLLSGFGLMIGRLGDAIGEIICLFLANRLLILVGLTTVLFLAAVAVFFKLYQTLYIPRPRQPWTEKEKFLHFSMEHDLSAREQDLLRFLLDGKTNSEIADDLSISENTVKFHVRNILQKTGCKNRNDLRMVYLGYSRP